MPWGRKGESHKGKQDLQEVQLHANIKRLGTDVASTLFGLHPSGVDFEFRMVQILTGSHEPVVIAGAGRQRQGQRAWPRPKLAENATITCKSPHRSKALDAGALPEAATAGNRGVHPIPIKGKR